jgi:hypothetical protein
MTSTRTILASIAAGAIGMALLLTPESETAVANHTESVITNLPGGSQSTSMPHLDAMTPTTAPVR